MVYNIDFRADQTRAAEGMLFFIGMTPKDVARRDQHIGPNLIYSIGVSLMIA